MIGWLFWTLEPRRFRLFFIMKKVRIKPYNFRKGHVVSKYTYGPTGQRFEEKTGWYNVDDSTAEKLKKLHQLESDPDSPAMFDVLSPEDAEELEAAEVQEHSKHSAKNAVDLTTQDLPQDPVHEEKKAAYQPKKSKYPSAGSNQ